MAQSALHYLELLEVGRRIQSRQQSSVEVTQALLQRIEALEPQLHSYSCLTQQQALEDARRADEDIARGLARGPLHGVPIAIKDLLWMRGTPVSHGMTLHPDTPSTEDATCVRRLRDAGAVLLGKLQQTEGAFAYHHPKVTAPVNPWDASLWPGISSSGSGVATAAGLCFGSLGTDTGGSIRYPSAANGLTGIKPTWGRVSRHGAFELAASLDHIGPMARSAADAAAILAAIAGPDPLDPTAAQCPVPDYLATMTRGLRGLRVGIDRHWALDGVDAPIQQAVMEALRVVQEQGAVVQEVQFPDVSQSLLDWMPLCAVETAVAHEATYPSRRGDYGPGLAGLLELGHGLHAMDYQKLLLRRADLKGRVHALFQSVDLLLVPALPIAAAQAHRMADLSDDPALLLAIMRYTCPFDMTGHPTITLPGGQTAQGAPVAFQFVAPHFGEHLLVQAGWAYQRATHWHRRHPPLP